MRLSEEEHQPSPRSGRPGLMRKLDRLAWVERTFGSECVMPYRACRTWGDIRLAISWHEEVPRTWGMRTDRPGGAQQGFNLPFLFHGTHDGAHEIWEAHTTSLVYIVSKNIPSVQLNAVAMRIAPEHILIEWNSKEKTISQRQMYDRLENVRRAVFGPGSGIPWNRRVWRVMGPLEGSQYRFDKVYQTMMTHNLDEVTFSVAADFQLVVW